MALAFSSDGKLLATALSTSIEIRDWRQLKDKPLRLLPLSGIGSLASSPDGRWLAASGRHGRVFVEDLRSPPNKPAELEKHEEGATPDLLFEPSRGRWLATFSGKDESARLYSLTGKEPKVEKVWNGITTIALSPGGRWLASASGGDIALHDLHELNAAPKLLIGHLGNVRALAFSPDLHWLASTGVDNTIRLWDLTAGDPSATGIVLSEHRFADWMEFSPNRPWLFGSSGGSVWRWDLRLNCLKELACRVAGRSLSQEEWRAVTGLNELPPDTCALPLPGAEAAECADVLARIGG